MIRVFIIDDHPVVRKGVRGLLEEFQDIQMVGESDGAPGTVELCADAKPNIILLDIKLQHGDGIMLCRILGRKLPDVKVVILTSYDDETYLLNALHSGAQGYLLKSSSPEILAETLRAVNNGERRISTSLMTAALQNLERMSGAQVLSSVGLTEEDRQLLQMLAEGSGNQQIAEQLFMSDRTVKRKLQDLMDKMGVTTRAQAVAEGFKRGIL